MDLITGEIKKKKKNNFKKFFKKTQLHIILELTYIFSLKFSTLFSFLKSFHELSYNVIQKKSKWRTILLRKRETAGNRVGMSFPFTCFLLSNNLVIKAYEC